MTVSNQTSKNVYVGDTVTLVFAYTFRIFADGDLEVTIQDTSVDPQTEITLVLNTDYTVSGADNPTGGNVTLLLGGQLSVAPIATDNITIRRNLPFIQPTDYVENDPFPAESHEKELDRGTMIDQQIQEQLDRALVLPANITGIDVTLPTPSPGAAIGWNDTGTGLTNDPDGVNQVSIDSDATPDFIGATNADGVLRTGSSLTYVDGGDFVTINTIQDIQTSASPQFNGLTLSSLTMNNSVTEILDEDTLVSDSATALATQQSIKAYVDSQTAAQNEFTELTDTPASYAGAGGNIVRVNVGATALEFITIGTLETALNHDNLTGFVANEHIDHTTVDIATAAGTSGLAGGGDISATRNLSVDIANTTAGTVASLDEVLIADVDDSDNLKRVTAQSIADLGSGTTVFTGLTDTPASYVGQGLLGLRVNAGETALEFVSLSTGADFLTLTDTPGSYAGQGGLFVRVNPGETALEFVAGGGGSLTQDVNQTTHGFSVGDWLGHNGTIYVLAQADNATNAEVFGVVSAVAGANDFTIQVGGYITGLSGLTAGEAHFLDAATAGAISATAPSGVGEIIKPVIVADSTTSGFIFNMRGSSITDSTSHITTFTNANLVGGVLSINHNFGRQYVIVQVFDDSDLQIIPDEVDLVDTNNTDIDLTSFGAIAGTWHAVIMDTGTFSSVSSDTFQQSFVDADLTAGVLTVTHNLSNQYNNVTVYNNLDQVVQPDQITANTTNALDVDLSSFGTLTGTWNVVVQK